MTFQRTTTYNLPKGQLIVGDDMVEDGDIESGGGGGGVVLLIPAETTISTVDCSGTVLPAVGFDETTTPCEPYEALNVVVPGFRPT